MAVTQVTTATFRREVLESPLPVLIDLWAEWCGPCRQLSPRVESVAQRLEGRLKVVKINVDQNPDITQAFRAQNIPLLVVVVGGRPVKTSPGLITEAQIMELVEPYLPGAEDEVPAKELPALIKAGRVTVVDLRDPPVFARAHIPGAVNVPSENLALSVGTLALDRRPVVVYDRSGAEAARQAFEQLTAQGLPAAILKGGFLAWESEGFGVERSS